MSVSLMLLQESGIRRGPFHNKGLVNLFGEVVFFAVTP